MPGLLLHSENFFLHRGILKKYLSPDIISVIPRFHAVHLSQEIPLYSRSEEQKSVTKTAAFSYLCPYQLMSRNIPIKFINCICIAAFGLWELYQNKFDGNSRLTGHAYTSNITEFHYNLLQKQNPLFRRNYCMQNLPNHQSVILLNSSGWRSQFISQWSDWIVTL